MSKTFTKKEVFKIMRITILQLIIVVFLGSITYARTTYAQERLKKKITLICKESSLKNILRDLEKQADIQFSYRKEVVESNEKFTFNFRNETLEQILNQILLPQKVYYSIINDKQFILKKNKVIEFPVQGFLEKRVTEIANEMAGITAADITIKGKITDAETGEALPGVSISVKGTTRGTSSNANGEYSLSVPNTKAVIVFTFVGYGKQEIPIGNRNQIDVRLKAENKALEEVVVIGYGSQKRKDLTGSVASVTMEDINKAPVRSFDEALAGRVAGVQVTSADGRPGGGVDIVIRGNNSVTGANSPLYVIDGFITEGPNNNVINPADIASIDILKDASATAIYGARGANGVVVITTKKGKQGKPVYSFNSTIGIQNNMKQMAVLSPYEYVKYQLENDPTLVSTSPYPSPTEIYLTRPGRTLDYYKTVTPINWQDLITRTALYKNYDFAVRGGTKKVKYSLSASATDQDGILINSAYERYQGRAVVDYQATNKLKIGINANYSFLKQTGIDPSRGNNGATTNIMSSVWGYKPLSSDNSDITEQYSDPDFNPGNDYRTNPIIALQQLYNVTKTNNIIANGYIEYLLAKDLIFRSTVGIIDNRSESGQFYSSKTQQGRGTNGVNGRIDNNNSTNFLNENTLTWNQQLSPKSRLNVLGGFTLQKTKTWYYGQAANQLSDSLGLAGLDKGVQLRVDPSTSVSTMASFLSRVNYTLASKYILTASFRADGSSKFPPENHWGYFPSGAVAWNFSQENFLKNSKSISDGKLRFSYGQTGNNRIGDFDYLTRYFNPIGNSYVVNNQYVQGIVPTRLGNSDLKWETTEQINAGIDLGFFKQRIMLTIDVYKKTTRDLLLNTPLPTSVGFNTAQKNIGSVQNKGLEVTLTTQNINTKDFTWTTSANISFNSNKLLALAEGQTDLQTAVAWDNNVTYPGYIAKVGEPLGQMYGFQWLGTYKYDDFNTSVNSSGATVYTLKPEIATNGNVRANIKPGDIKYKDINGDGIVNAKDYTVIGNGLPIHTGGISNNFTYKGFDLNVFFQWSYGNNLMNVNRIMFEGAVGASKNQFASYANRWTPDNPTSDIPRVGGTNGIAAGYSSRTVEDGSYLRLKTVALGYNVDSKFTRRLHLKSLRFFVSGQNLVTWTNYSGMDPEVNTYRSVLTPGFDFSAYPRARTFAFGINVTF